MFICVSMTVAGTSSVHGNGNNCSQTVYKFVSLLSSSVVKAQTPLIINFLHELRLLTHEYYDDTGFLHTLNSNEVETWKIYNFRDPPLLLQALVQ